MSNSQTLTHRVVKSGFWVFALRIVGQILSFIRLIILARILSPNDFGLMGIALLTLSILETFSQPGFHQALIQKKDNVESYLDSAWSVLIIRGFFLALIVYLIAPFASIFFKSPQAKPIIQAMGLSILLRSFTNIGVVYFQKELEFNKQFILELTGTLADFVVAITFVFLLRNVWALVLGLIAGNVARCIASYIIHPYRPHFSTDFTKARELWNFGRWVTWSNILVFLLTQGDDIFVGKFLGATALGLYQFAYRISNMPATEITNVISQVAFPAYSKLQDNIPKLREAYLKVLQVAAFLSFPISGLIFVLAPNFTKIFLGEKWIPMVPAMQVLVFWGLVRSIGATAGPIINATGKPKILTMYLFLQLITLIILIYPFTMHWGIFGTSWAVLFASMGSNALAFYTAIKITNCGIYNFIKMISFPLTSTLIAIVSVFLLMIYWNAPYLFLIPFVLSLIFYGLVYFGITYIFNRFSTYKIQHLLKEILLASLAS